MEKPWKTNKQNRTDSPGDALLKSFKKSTSIQHCANPKNTSVIGIRVRKRKICRYAVTPIAVFTPKKTRYIMIYLSSIHVQLVLFFHYCPGSMSGSCLRMVSSSAPALPKVDPTSPGKKGETLLDRHKNHIWKHQLSQRVFVDLSDPDVDRMKAEHQLQLRLKAKIASMP